jgi:hypothetical protein
LLRGVERDEVEAEVVREGELDRRRRQRAATEALIGNRPALAGPGPDLAGSAALAGLISGFSRFALLRDPILYFSPAISGAHAGFSRFGILRKKFVDLGANWKMKSSIPAKIRGIGARKFVEM